MHTVNSITDYLLMFIFELIFVDSLCVCLHTVANASTAHTAQVVTVLWSCQLKKVMAQVRLTWIYYLVCINTSVIVS